MKEMLLRYRNWLLMISALVAVLVGLYLQKNTEKEHISTPLMIEETVEEADIQSEDYMVDIKGAVKNPGVYETSADERVVDIIKKAGGLEIDADPSKINYAQRVEDEMVILVPKVGEMAEGNLTQSQPMKININKASKEELETLSGVGPSKAEAIINHREEEGLFKSVEDILNVTGIGEKMYEKIKDEIST
ncbi:helix-hairpin-helix domain-containing protein [Bacillus sp. 2205SS5-2]|uniref:helix-hairpin-helix domain-containing protein n=1 Tax=Bacillus sp. 2205SS5-2 TaxID=3109031 RepID=UPI003006AFCE